MIGLKPSVPAHLRAPAKVNLGLKIVGRRPDGYHLLQSIFAPVALYDEIRIEVIEESAAADRIEYRDSNGSPLTFPSDTIAKTLGLVRTKVPDLPNLFIQVQKGIPERAGLGGGSSDAASVLKWLGSAMDYGWTEKTLLGLAQKVGADVPFFLQERTSFVQGIGEQILPVETDRLWFILGKPPFGVSTRDAFTWLDADCKLTESALGASSKAFAVFREIQAGRIKKLGLQDLVEILDNDLEKPIEARHPEITGLKKALMKYGAFGAQMTGSGSCVFGIFESEDKAQLAVQNLRRDFMTGFVFFTCRQLA